MRKNPTVDGFETDPKNSEKSLPTAPKKRRKANQVKIQEREIFESNRGDESSKSNSILDENIIHIYRNDCQNWMI